MAGTVQIIAKDSKLCAQSELDLFEAPPTVEQIEKTTCMPYRSSSSLENTKVIEFFIAGTGEEYIDLQETKLHLQCKLLTLEGKKIDKDKTTTDKGGPAPTNNLLHSLFSQVDVYLNDKLVSTSNNLYPYRAYLETLLNHGNDPKDSHLTCALYYPDASDNIELAHGSPDYQANSGMKKRQEVAITNTQFDLIGPIHSDFFHQNRYLLNNVDVKIRFVRTSDAFCVMGNGKMVIDQATLFVHKVRLSPSLMLAHAQLLTKRPARYPFHRVEMKSFSIAQGQMSVNRDNIVLGQLPTHVMVGLVDSEAESGKALLNPFNFQHFNLNYLSLQVGSEQIPSTPLQPDFKEGLYIREYQQLLESIGFWHSDKGVNFSREDYPKGYTLYGFNLTPNKQQCSEAFNLLKQGNLQLNMKFAEKTPKTITVILYLVYQNMMEIDHARNVLFDFAT